MALVSLARRFTYPQGEGHLLVRLARLTDGLANSTWILSVMQEHSVALINTDKAKARLNESHHGNQCLQISRLYAMYIPVGFCGLL